MNLVFWNASLSLPCPAAIWQPVGHLRHARGAPLLPKNTSEHHTGFLAQFWLNSSAGAPAPHSALSTKALGKMNLPVLCIHSLGELSQINSAL